MNKKCIKCKGLGRIDNPIYKNDPNPDLWRAMDCPKCNGNGKAPRNKKK